eukprot:gb/GFBE01048955.1/.p1 GENE.gb/GFBE01048955.1/~~gb/GFBE01048955.1/.p1  ORF type:complete len:148 (+),score=20.27 gb/GFBE01048955.1/:1-444(+)
MTAVQNDRAWRKQMEVEVVPLDRPRTSASQLALECKNPLSWNYGAEPRPFSRSSRSSSLSYCSSDSRLYGSSSASSITKSSLSRAGRSSLGSRSQAVRSSVLSIELEHERELREAAEKEIAELRAKLAKADPSQMPAAGFAKAKDKA